MQNMSIDKLKEKLQNSQYKMTPHRRTVLEVFLSNEGKHLSAEDVHAYLREKDSDIGMATVYRTLDLLCEIEVLQKMDFGDGCARYEPKVNGPNSKHHHHLICRACGKVIEFSDDLLDDLEKSISKKCDFAISDCQIKFFGYCGECQKLAGKKV